MKGKLLFTATLFILLSTQIAFSQSDWNAEQKEIIKAIEVLSASTAPDGGGADAYAKLMTADFSRWTMGSQKLIYKNEWVESIREWFDEGWRVSDRENQFLEIRIDGDFAFVRRIVSETYLGPDGDTSKSKASVSGVWKRVKDKWFLYHVEVHPVPNS